MNEPIHFSHMQVERPEPDAVAARFQQCEAELQAGRAREALEAWDALRRELGTYSSLAGLRYAQNTADPEAKAERDFKDSYMPRLTDRHVRMKRGLLQHRAALAPSIGEHVFRLWECDIAAFNPAIEDDLVQQAKVGARYTGLLASAEIEVDGETHNLSSVRKFASSSDRSLRHRADRATWNWVGAQAEQFDELFDELVAIRDRMARAVGFDDYVPLAYLLRQRIDYNRDDVARFRDEVRAHVVPLAEGILAAQARRLGVDKVMKWDEAVFDREGGPRLIKSGEGLLAAATEMFDRLHPDMGTFFRMMANAGLMDLESRPNKAPGGFCTSLETFDVPFVYANFNGTRGDVEVFTHEMGHAFQCWSSIRKFPLDLVWPTFESCEIHSMSLEFLCWPSMDLFFGGDADRFRAAHLSDALTFLPYGCAVDHFQQLVYENPAASHEDRYEMWRQVRDMYLPWRDWGDVEHGVRGGRWHVQSHIFQTPFYYIDYVLAQTCALQFWERAERDPQEAITSYVALCARGGEAPFQELARSAGLRSPFEEGCLESVVERARQHLNL